MNEFTYLHGAFINSIPTNKDQAGQDEALREERVVDGSRRATVERVEGETLDCQGGAMGVARERGERHPRRQILTITVERFLPLFYS